MPTAPAPPQDARNAPAEPRPASGGEGYSGFDPLAETVRPSPADVAVTRQLSRPGARRAEPKPADPPGYRLRHLLGRGGFGAVWLATESATGKQVAVKTFRHVRALDWPLLTREVEKLAALDASRHVVQLLGVGWEADPPYYVMEYLPDGSLADLLDTAAPLPPARAAELAEGIAAGLVHAHGSGILHCDLKPGNVLLDRDGGPRLCDFGQARGVGAGDGGGTADDSASESRTGGRPLGTLFYMPPEQVAPDAAPDARWDVYALGAVLYEMLTGHPPHRTDELSERLKRCSPGERLAVYAKEVKDAPRPTEHLKVRGIDAALVRIVDRCLNPDCTQRYPNAQAVRTALRQRSEDAARRSRARWALLGPAAVAAALLVVGTLLVGRTLEAGRGQVVERAMEANALSAGLVAHSLEQVVNRQRVELEQIAADPRLADLIADATAAGWEEGAARSTLFSYLSLVTPAVVEEQEEQAAATADGATDLSWFLQDATGMTRWRNPPDDEVVDHSFVWRDYFHGQGKHLPPDTPVGSIPPVDRTHVSLSYRSTSTEEWKLAITTPIRDAEGNIVALLARTALLDALLSEYDSTKRTVTHEGQAGDDAVRYTRVIALYERQSGRLLDHPWLAKRPDTRIVVELPDGERQAIDAALADGRGSFRTDRHLDPTAAVDGGQAFAGMWISAFAPVGGTDWVVVVQEPRDDALRLMEGLGERLRLVGAFVVGGLVLTLGGLLYWFTRDRAGA
ncbi:serine/threonine protein kinase [Alienimonas californiensis]|uniref:Serine/threonine-protein kinase PknB n=1 Tax=Alienimonas californiensis TaxID=2527989 RepID=A0A517PCY2_9PLAN|nr:serine/threonine protein kinase [Alienimonas californiensis]QDT17237.1 Serine/threonine-protein kinase PknB [Alienimonas californiensis]